MGPGATMLLEVCDEAILDLDGLRDEPLSDDKFFQFCVQNPQYRIERTAEGRIVVMSGTGGKTGNRNAALTWALFGWARQNRHGVAFDSSTLFRLPSSAMRSPDASWVLRERLQQLSAEWKEKYLPLCPDFVVELTSPSDRIATVSLKMEEWMDNGCQLGWLIDVRNCELRIYRPSHPIETLQQPTEATAGPPLNGFTLDLASIWDPDW